jgi:hypothetical protein
MTITINGQTFELNAEQESKLKTALGLQGKQLSEIAVGEIANVAGIDWIVFEQNGDTTLCLAKDFVYENTKFDDNTNNYANSSIRQTLNGEFLDKLTKEIGADAILATEIDLTSDDGLDDYGKVTDKIGLLTCDMYRKYNRIIENYKVNDWWWLATPYSTPHRGYDFAVRCVYSFGALLSSGCNFNYGVRPFCTFKSSIFVS